jgi:HD-GYP domain-containing protein (c-di-GMP phosphodiesterase class II)
MIINPQVPLHRLVLSMADAMDCVHHQISNHQLRVAYIATNIARRLGYKGQPLLVVFLASAFHDIGMIRSDNRMLAVHFGKLEGLGWHCEAGYRLLADQPVFATAAELIRFHHTEWDGGRGTQSSGQPVPLGSHMIHAADEIDRMVDRDAPILQQRDQIRDDIRSLAGRKLKPDCVDAVCALSESEAFWLDCASDRIYGVLLKQVDWPTMTLDESAIMPIAEVFGRLVDAASPWTATHSAGVTASAVALADRLDFSPREQTLMRAAGYLHDLGKLTIPASILDKPAGLTPDEILCMRQHTYHTFRILDTIGGMPQIAEWAAFHHERLDGTGYPFHHAGRDLTLGSRIMAVADVFTAVTEDRPYRAGMSESAAMGVLDKLVASGGLDGDVVEVLQKDFQAINATRLKEQADYAERQKYLATYLNYPQTAVALPA